MRGRRIVLICRGALLAAVLMLPAAAPAEHCSALLGWFQQGFSSADIADATGLSIDEVERCRAALHGSLTTSPAGPPPLGAPGPPPLGAAGRPPVGPDVNRRP